MTASGTWSKQRTHVGFIAQPGPSGKVLSTWLSISQDGLWLPLYREKGTSLPILIPWSSLLSFSLLSLGANKGRSIVQGERGSHGPGTDGGGSWGYGMWRGNKWTSDTDNILSRFSRSGPKMQVFQEKLCAVRWAAPRGGWFWESCWKVFSISSSTC